MRLMTKRPGAVLVMAMLCTGCEAVVVPTGPSLDPVTETFASLLTVRGTASRTFTVRDTGTIALTLTDVAGGMIVGLGVGIPRADGTSCNLSQSVETTGGATPQITTTADGGSYCVKLFDVGTLSDAVSFSVTIVHP